MSSPSHHRVSPSTGRFWLAGVMGSGSANISDHRELQAVPPLPPQHPKTRQGQGHPDTGHPQAPSCIRLAGESHKPYLPETVQAAGCRKWKVLQVVLAGAELSTQFYAFSALRDVKRGGGHCHTLSHPCHCTAAGWGPTGPRLGSVSVWVHPFCTVRASNVTERKTKLSHPEVVQHRSRDQRGGGIPSRRCSKLAGCCAA